MSGRNSKIRTMADTAPNILKPSSTKLVLNLEQKKTH